MLLHGLLLVAVFLFAAFGLRGPAQKFMYTLALAPLIRLVSLSTPLATFQATYWYVVIGLPLLLSAYLVWRLTGLRRERVGLSLGASWPLQTLVGLSGLALGYLENQILKPQPLVPEFSLGQVWAPALILLVFTGFLEEFIFRGLMQAAAAPVLRRLGVLYISLLFAVLHIGYQSAIDIVFVFLVGLYFALVVERTRSLAGVTLAHALTNIALFLIVPYL
jgi:membrane protease YdiL (CAAX protease family)